MKYFKLKCDKCLKIKRLIFQEKLDSQTDREVKLSTIYGESWIDGLIPPLDEFCLGDCDSELNLVGRVQKYLIAKKELN
jgi:hypothetical protein